MAPESSTGSSARMASMPMARAMAAKSGFCRSTDANAMRHGIGHGPVSPGPHQPALAVHLQVAGGPYGRGADIGGERGILRCGLADDSGKISRMDRLVPRLASRQIVQTLPRVLIMLRGGVQMMPAALTLSLGRRA